jgi:hypothetical protein
MVFREQTYEVRPPTDDKPFFFHFFKWRQVPEIWQTLGRTWQPFGGGGYLVLLALLAMAVLTSVVLIVLPAGLTRRSGETPAGLPRGLVLAYFGCLGVAYLAVEIPLIQRFVLLVDHPTTAFAIVLSVLLITSGIGSLLAPRLRAWWVMPTLVFCVLVLSVSSSSILGLLLGRSLVTRAVAASALLVPLGLLMGVPFPTGLALVRRRAPHLIPWAWGVNGCTSVVVSIATALMAMSWGFGAVLGVAVTAYLLAWGLLIRMQRIRI